MCDKALLMSSECGGESAFNIFSTGLVERWQESIYIFQVSLSTIIKSMACFFVFLKKNFGWFWTNFDNYNLCQLWTKHSLVNRNNLLVEQIAKVKFRWNLKQ